jgi:hypothetical protein
VDQPTRLAKNRRFTSNLNCECKGLFTALLAMAMMVTF